MRHDSRSAVAEEGAVGEPDLAVGTARRCAGEDFGADNLTTAGASALQAVADESAVLEREAELPRAVADNAETVGSTSNGRLGSRDDVVGEDATVEVDEPVVMPGVELVMA